MARLEKRDYGVVDFVSLFAHIIEGPGSDSAKPSARRTEFYTRFEYGANSSNSSDIC